MTVEWKDLIGKKIKAFRGHKNQRTGSIELQYILFDDGQTFISLQEQDPYDYHDCSQSARILYVHSHVHQWRYMLDNYPEPTTFDF